MGRLAKAAPGYQLRNPDEYISFSNDPYLTGSLAEETIRGIQERGVMTSAKVCIHVLRLPRSLFQVNCSDSTTLVTNKKPTATPPRIRLAKRLPNRSHQTSTIRLSTSFTFGPCGRGTSRDCQCHVFLQQTQQLIRMC